MSHSNVQFDVWRYADGTIHLNFEDVLGGIGDVYLSVNPDGTVDEQVYDDVADEFKSVRVGNLYERLDELLRKADSGLTFTRR